MRGKVWIYKFLFIVGFGMAAGFIIQLCKDAGQYKLYALPFYYLLFFRVIEYLLPAVFLIISGYILRKKVISGQV